MLVRTLQKANHQWAVKESLVAACRLCGTEVGCCAILRHGMLEAVERAMQQESQGTLLGIQALCAELLSAVGNFRVSKDALASRPATALVIVDALKSLVEKTTDQFEVGNPKVLHDLMTALATATSSYSSRRALLTCSLARGQLDSRLWDVKNYCYTTTPAYLTICKTIRIGVACLGRWAHAKMNAPAVREQHIFGLLQAACEVLEYVGSQKSLMRNVLGASVAEMCVFVIVSVRSYAALRKNNCVGAHALAAAVATLKQVNIVAGHVDTHTLRGLPIVYDVLRSQLSSPRIQQHGIQLMHDIGQTAEGANRLDVIPASWQWLGKVHLHTPNNGKPSQKGQIAQTGNHGPSIRGWNYTRLGAFLNLNALKKEYCDQLEYNAEELRIFALLPFESETLPAWESRILNFQYRNQVNLGPKFGSSRAVP